MALMLQAHQLQHTGGWLPGSQRSEGIATSTKEDGMKVVWLDALLTRLTRAAMDPDFCRK
jgi:hypothetical protein